MRVNELEVVLKAYQEAVRVSQSIKDGNGGDITTNRDGCISRKQQGCISRQKQGCISRLHQGYISW